MERYAIYYAENEAQNHRKEILECIYRAAENIIMF